MCDSTTDAGERNQLRTGLSLAFFFYKTGVTFHPYAFLMPENERMDHKMKETKLFTDEVMRDMGKRIQIVRKKKGYKAIDFADIIGIGKDQLSRIENGKVPCKMEYLFTIALTLEVSTDYLIFGKDIGTELESIARIVGNDKIKLTKIKTIAEVVYGE